MLGLLSSCSWVLVKEFDLNYHNTENALSTNKNPAAYSVEFVPFVFSFVA